MDRANESRAATIERPRRRRGPALRDAARVRARSLLLRGGTRVAALDRNPRSHRMIVEVIRRALPRRFDASAAGDLEATFELRIRDPHGGEPTRFALSISHGRCAVAAGGARGAATCITLGADDAIALVTGGAGWPELLSSGRLELSGDPFLGLRFPNLFRLPVRGAEPHRHGGGAESMSSA